MRDFEEGRIYLEHLRLEHKHLHQAIANTQEMLLEVLGEGAVNGRREMIVVRLSDLRDQLTAHFAREEEGGYLEMAVSRVPQLSAAVRRLEQQHPSLLLELNVLIHDGAIPPKESMARFKAFRARMLEHEAEENRVMAQAFGCNGSDE